MSKSFQVYTFSWPRMTLCTQLWLRTNISTYTIFQWVPVHIHTPTCLLDQYCIAWHLSSWRSSLETDSVKWALCTVAQRGGPKRVWPAISPWNGSQKISRVDFSSTWMRSGSWKAKTPASCSKDVRVKIQKKVHRVMQRLKVKAVQIWTPSGCISCLGSSEMLVNSCDVSHEQHKYKTYKRTHAACPTKTCLAIRHFSGAFSLVSPVDGLLRLLLWWAQMQNHWEPCRLSWLHLHTTYNPMMAGIGHVINCHLQFKEILILNLFWFLMIICKLYYLDVTYSFLIKSRVPNENICWTAKLWRDFLGPCDRCDSCTLRPGIDLFNHDAHAQLGCENWFWCFWTPSKSFWNIFTRHVVQDSFPNADFGCQIFWETYST